METPAHSPLPISCFIIARNEGDRIAATIESVKPLVQEIIVIDSGSTDNTVAVCEVLGVRVFYHAWPGYGLQKRFGEEQCANDWLLNLDADEVLTPVLVEEIRAYFSYGLPSVAGFFLPVRDLLPGEKTLAPFAHTNHCLRLYNKHKARFSDSPVHDSVIVQEGATRTLHAPVLHYSFRSLSHMVEKINAYTTAQALHLQKKGLKHAHFRLLVEFPIAFFKIYFLRGYALRGWRGFMFAVIFACGRFIRIAKTLELRTGKA